MPRQKKDAKILNIKLAREISNQLEQFCEESGISKTVATEKILSKYFEEYFSRPEEKRRLGEKRTMNCGLEAEIIRYGAYADIDVRFEDGYIARHAAYKEFLNGSIRPPIDRVGETGIMNNGLKATIIAYRKHIDMDVLFEDGSVAEHIDYKNFTEGRVARPQDSRRNRGKFRIGEKRIMKCGLEAEIISYRKREDMDVRFPDGVIVKNVQYTNFKRGMVGHP